MSGSSTKIPQISPVDKKFIKNEASTVDLSSLIAISQDTSVINKKRPYSWWENKKDWSDQNRIDTTHDATTFWSAYWSKQPIETDPDSVKSLLKECFAASLTNSILLNGESYKLK